MEDKKIILATDGSMPALAATKKAVAMARESHAAIYAVTVLEHALQTDLEKMQEDVAEAPYRKIRAEGLAVAEAYCAQFGVPFVGKTIRKTPIVAAILEYAREIKPDAIVLGNSGRHGFERLSMGSVAESLANHSEFPVVICKVADVGDLDDIVAIALQHGVPAPEKPPAKKPAAISDEAIRRKLLISAGTLMTFLIPYFGLAILTSFARDVAAQEFLFGLSTAMFLIFALFPIGWVVAMGFNRTIAQYD